MIVYVAAPVSNITCQTTFILFLNTVEAKCVLNMFSFQAQGLVHRQIQ